MEFFIKKKYNRKSYRKCKEFLKFGYLVQAVMSGEEAQYKKMTGDLKIHGHHLCQVHLHLQKPMSNLLIITQKWVLWKEVVQWQN